MICLDNGSVQMLENIIENRDNQGEPVQVIIAGKSESFRLELNDELTNGMIHLYNLFVEAGGTSENNMYLVPKDVFSSWKYTTIS